MFIHCVLLILSLALAGRVHTGEIIGGHEAVPHSRPYMALLELHKHDGNTTYCSGFLLNEDFVMTAAHCQAKSHTVLLGLHSMKKHTEIQHIPVEQTFPCKDYNSTNYRNDIMLLKLSSKATFTKNVKPIALAGQDGGPQSKSCLVSGWGSTTDDINGMMSVVLMEVNVTLIDNEECAKNNVYCSEGKAGVGRGDSGGPLVCDGKAYGVVSYKLNTHPVLHCYAKIPDSSWFYKTMANA